MPSVHYNLVPIQPAAHSSRSSSRSHGPRPTGSGSRCPRDPGSYLIREFAKNIVRIEAFDDVGAVALTKRDKDTWVAAPCQGALRVRYEVYAWDLSVRTAHLDRTHGYFNGTSVFLRVHGAEDAPHTVRIGVGPDPACADWTVHTTLPRVAGEPHEPGLFQAADYDELVDHPVEMGTPVVLRFEACGVPHEVMTGRFACDTERLLRDLTTCEHHIRFFGEPAPWTATSSR